MNGKSEIPKILIYRNKDRQAASFVESPRPQYEELGRYPAGYDLKQGKLKSAVIFKHERDKIMKDFNMHKRPKTVSKVGTVSGFADDQSWNDPKVVSVASPQVREQFEFNMNSHDPNEEIYEEESVPDPDGPPLPEEESIFLILHEVPSHSIMLVVRDEAFFCNSLDEAEEQVSYLVFQEKVPVAEISIIYKAELNVGTFIKSKL